MKAVSGLASAASLRLALLAPPRELQPDPDRDNRPEVDRQVDQDVAGMREREHILERGRHWFTADSSQRPRLVKPTITHSIQYCERVASSTLR